MGEDGRSYRTQRRGDARRRSQGSSGGRGRASVGAEPTDNAPLIVARVERSKIVLLDAGSGVVVDVDLADGALPTSDQFVVGDRVELVYEGEEIVNVRRGARRTVLARFRTDASRKHTGEEHVLAANVDTVVIVVPGSAVKTGLLDRYLILAEYGEIEPIICVNKIDRWDDPAAEAVKAEAVLAPYADLGVPIVMVSAARGDNLDVLRARLEGRTSVLSGQSGVGKSSLVNALVGEALLRTQETRTRDDRGRHTTTFSSIVALDPETLLIDTPGIRQLENLLRDEPTLLRFYFREFQEIAEQCRYGDCVHIPEPECAVKEEVQRALRSVADASGAAGSVSPQRYESYVRLADPDMVLRRAAELSVRDAGDVLTPWVELGASVLDDRGDDGPGGIGPA